jgi:hypothetical protein
MGKKCQKIRRGLVSKFSERATKLGIASNQAPPATINDLKILTRMLYAKGDEKKVLNFKRCWCFNGKCLGVQLIAVGFKRDKFLLCQVVIFSSLFQDYRRQYLKESLFTLQKIIGNFASYWHLLLAL